jgi:type II secretory pathway pseudopilin PulG
MAVNQKRTGPTAGMTLIEMLVATGLLILGLSTFLSAFSGLRRVSVTTDRRTAAMHRARQVLEGVMEQPYDSTALNFGAHALSGASYTISLCNDFATTKDIVVTVPWIDPQGSTQRDLKLEGSMASCLH